MLGGVSTLWRALLEGVGWRLGREAAEDAIRSLRGKGDAAEEAAAPEESPEALARRLEREAREAARAAEAARKAAEKRKKDEEREVERELRALKASVAKGQKR